MSKHTRIGIIGAGGNAGVHVRHYKQMKDVEVVAVADITPGKADEFMKQQELHGATAFEDHRKMLELDLDGVSICTPNVAHHQTSVDALQAGKHVLVEKPMSVTLEQAIEMVQSAKHANKILTVGFQTRYDPNKQTVRKIVESGQLGKVYYVQACSGRRRGIPPRGSFVNKEIAGSGALADIGCYSLDLVMDALGHPKPLSVSAVTSDYFGKNPKYYAEPEIFNVEDFGSAFIRFEGGLVMNFTTSWAMHMDSLGSTVLLGTEGGLKITPEQRPNPAFNGDWGGSVGAISLFHDIQDHQSESVIPVQTHQTNVFYEKVHGFVVAIQEGKQAPIPGEQLIRSQAIIDGMLRSAQLGREVEIDIPKI